MQLFIRTVEGKTITIDVNPNEETILNIKEKIFAKEAIPIDQQRIIFSGKQCEDERRCNEYSFEKEGHIFLVIRKPVVQQSENRSTDHFKDNTDNNSDFFDLKSANKRFKLNNEKLIRDRASPFKFLKLCAVFPLSAILSLAAGGLIGGLFGAWPDFYTFFQAISSATGWGIGVAVASGILALGATNMVGWKAYGKVSLNPFSGIIETTASPHARTLRTGFFEKVKDACMVFFGNSKDIFSQLVGISDDRSPEHLGLLDGATLFLSGSLEKLNQKALEHPHAIIKGTFSFSSDWRFL